MEGRGSYRGLVVKVMGGGWSCLIWSFHVTKKEVALLVTIATDYIHLT